MPPDAEGAARRPLPAARIVLPVLALVLLIVVGLLPAPYAIEQPGPVFDTLGTSRVDGKDVPLISIPSRRTYPATGALDLLTVSIVGSPGASPNWLELSAAWADPARSVVPLEEIYPPGESTTATDAESAAEMKDSQASARAAALTALGYSVPGTVRVDAIEPRSAASGVLQKGDVVRSFAGTPVTDRCTLQHLIAAHGARPAAISISRAGRSRTVTVTPRAIEGSDRPLVGIVTSGEYRYPFTVTLRLDEVGGPSAGMMFALGIIDELTPGSLTGGRHVAGTGTICADGEVGAIGGIVQKMHAARSAGATVFLAPRDDCDEVTGHVPGGLSVFAVRTLKDSMGDLKVIAEGGSTAHLARCGAG